MGTYLYFIQNAWVFFTSLQSTCNTEVSVMPQSHVCVLLRIYGKPLQHLFLYLDIKKHFFCKAIVIFDIKSSISWYQEIGINVKTACHKYAAISKPNTQIRKGVTSRPHNGLELVKRSNLMVSVHVCNDPQRVRSHSLVFRILDSFSDI